MFNWDNQQTRAQRAPLGAKAKTSQEHDSRYQETLSNRVYSLYSIMANRACASTGVPRAMRWVWCFGRHALPALCGCAGIFTVLYFVVRLLQSGGEVVVLTESTQRCVGYILLMVGYLLVPGVAGLLVRRRKAVAAARAVVEGVEGAAGEGWGCCSSEGWGVWGRGKIGREFERDAPVVAWEGESEECCVCLMEVEKGGEARVLKCGHAFHRNCVDGWVVGMRKNLCPLCGVGVVEGRDEAMREVR